MTGVTCSTNGESKKNGAKKGLRQREKEGFLHNCNTINGGQLPAYHKTVALFPVFHLLSPLFSSPKNILTFGATS